MKYFNKFSKIITLALAIVFAISCNVKDSLDYYSTIITFKLYNNDDGSGVPQTLYYNNSIQSKAWYNSNNISEKNKIDEIDISWIPSKEYVISYYNYDNTKIDVLDTPIEYKFDGYEVNGYGKITDDKGRINEDFAIKSNRNGKTVHAYATWITPDDFALPTEMDLFNSVPERNGYHFVGWSKTPKGNLLSADTNADEITTGAKSDNIALYALYEEDRVFNLTLDLSGNGDERDKVSVYYNNKKNQWQSDPDDINSTNVITDLFIADIPEKRYDITFDARGGYFDNDQSLSVKNLEYVYTVNDNSIKYIDKENNNQLNEKYIIVDNSKYKLNNALKLSSDVDAIPTFNGSVKNFPSDDSIHNAGHSFLGWSDSQESDNVRLIKKNDEYEYTGDVTFYANWQEVKFFTIKFINTNVTANDYASVEGTDTVYYLSQTSVPGEMGFYKEDKTTKLQDNFIKDYIPERIYKVSYAKNTYDYYRKHVDSPLVTYNDIIDEKYKGDETKTKVIFKFIGYTDSSGYYYVRPTEQNNDDDYKFIKYPTSDLILTPQFTRSSSNYFTLPIEEDIEYSPGEGAKPYPLDDEDLTFGGWKLHQGLYVYPIGSIVSDSITSDAVYYSYWIKQSDKLYAFTLINTDATGNTGNPAQFYYNQTKSRYQKNKLDTSEIIDRDTYRVNPLPIREYTITLNANGGYFNGDKNVSTKSIQTSYTFNGYWTKDANGNNISQVVDKNGKILPATINSNVEGYATWTGLGIDLTSYSKSVQKPLSPSVLYWATKDDEGNYHEVENPNNYLPNKDETIYAIWQEVAYYTITFDNQEATNSSDNLIDKLYYLPSSSVRDDVGFYIEKGNRDTKLSSIPTGKIPFKVHSVVYDNLKGQMIEPSEYRYIFNGYVYTDENNGKTTFINSDGSFNLMPSSDLVLKAEFTEPTAPIILPKITDKINNAVFKGWSRDKEGKDKITESTYRPTKEREHIYAIWNNIYTLKLDHANATNIPKLSEIYYNDTLGKWTSDSDGETEINTITKPEKSYTVTLDANGGYFDGGEISATIYSKYVFDGYKSNNTTYINKDGSIEINAAITEDITAEAVYLNGNVELLTPKSYSDEKKLFQGWAYTSEDTEPIITDNNYLPTSNIKLYAVWKNNPGHIVTLKHQNGRPDTRYLYMPDTKKWYNADDLNLSNEIKNPRFIPDSKVWTLSYDTNGVGSVDIPSKKIDFVFGGYSQDGTSTDIFVGADGVPINSKSIDKDIDLIAVWIIPTSENTFELVDHLDNVESYIFKGWSVRKNMNVPEYAPGAMYTVISTTDVTLYAIWHEVYSLTLQKSNATTAATVQAIYYNKTMNMWTSDSNGNTLISSINEGANKLPERNYTLVLDANGGTFNEIAKVKNIQGTYKFESFVNSQDNNEKYIDSNGIIDISKSIYRNTVAVPTFSFNSVILDSNGFSRVDYILKGWAKKTNATQKEYEINALFTPSSEDALILYAVWEKEDIPVYELTLINGEKGVLATVFYNSKYKFWTTKSLDEAGDYRIDITKPYLTTLPEKKITVTFDANEGVFDQGSSSGQISKKVVELPLVFDGFYNGDTRYIDKNGRLLDVPITSNVIANASYQNVNIPKDVFPAHSELRRSYKIFSGSWATSKEGYPIIGDEYSLGVNTTLYAVWQNAKYYTIALNHNGATNGNSQSAIYYLYESSNTDLERGYYSSMDNNSGSSKITTIIPPRKIWKLSYVSSVDLSIAPTSYEFAFDGYISGEDTYVNKNGVISEIIPNKDTEIIAQFISHEGDGVKLPSERDVGSVKNYIFKGWCKNIDRTDLITDATYVPTKEEDVVYALWYEIYKFTLKTSHSTEEPSSITEIYYNRTTKQWSLDSNGESIIDKVSSDNFPIVRRTLTVYGNGGKFDDMSDKKIYEVKLNFNGYWYWSYTTNPNTGASELIKLKCLISSEGIFDNSQADTIQSDATLISDYNPYMFNPLKLHYIHYENHDLVGWTDIPGSNSVKYFPDYNFSIYSDNLVLYTIWKKSNSISVVLDNDNGTPFSTCYYVPSSKKWYKDSNFLNQITLFDIPTPSKKWILTYDSNGANNANLTPTTKDLVFGGYSAEGNVDDVFVDIDGNILKNPSVSMRLKAIWTVPTSDNTVVLQGKNNAGTKSNSVFKGWAKNPTSTVIDYEGDGPYTIESSENVTLYAVWHKVFSVTLSQNEATTKTLPKIYYNATTSKWTSDPEGSVDISSIAIPERAYTVTFDANGGYFGSSVSQTTTTGTSKYSFDGFTGERNTIVDGTGKIVPTSISASIIATAKWSSGIITFPDTSLLHKTFKLFEDKWSLDSDGLNPVSSTYAPNSNVTLYAIWSPVSYFTIDLDHNGATSNSFASNRIYYLSTSSVSTDVGYYSSNMDSSESKITSFKQYIPQKEWLVQYNTTGGSISSIAPSTYSFIFNGYKNNTITYINPDGSFNSERPTDNITVTADFLKASSGITLPSSAGTKEKSVFKGWSETIDYNSTIINGAYHPTSQNTTLYAIWHQVYTLTLEEGLSTTPSKIKSIYYNFSTKKWTSDSQGENELITAIDKPQRNYKVILNANGGKFVTSDTTQTDTKELQGTYTFLNYVDKSNNSIIYIDSNAKINNNVSISEDKSAVPSFSIEAIKIDDNNVVLENFDLVGWSTSQDEDIPIEIEPGATYKPNTDVSTITLYAIWKKSPGIMVTLKHLNGDDDSIYYYSPNSKKWYIDEEFLNEVPNPTDPTFKPLNPKKWTLTYDTVGGEGVTLEPVTKNLKFSGYSTTGKQVEENTYINSDGKVIKTPTSSITLEAIWTVPDVDNTIILPSSAGTKIRSVFAGWGLNKNDSKVDYAPSGTYTMNTIEDVTLYAIWNSVYILTIEKGDADNDPETNALYFNTLTGKWSTDENGVNAIDTNLYRITIPEKTQSVTFDANGGTIDGEQLVINKYKSTFDGYKNENTIIINEYGKIEVNITSDCTVSPTWIINTIKIPELNIVNDEKQKVFFGWTNIDKNSFIVTHYTGEDYTLTEKQNNLYAVWNDVYTLTLDSSSADSPLSTTEIFYNANKKKWSTVRNNINEITTINGVSSLKKTIIIYHSGNGTTFKSDNAMIHETDRVFATYKSFNDLATGNICIEKDGKIALSEITKNTNANVDYDVPMTTKAFPSSSTLNAYPGKVFKGWALYSQASESECITKFQPNPYIMNIVYAVWGLPKYYTVKFDLDGGMYLDWKTFSEWVERGVKDNNPTMQNVKNNNPDYSNGTWEAGFEALKPIVDVCYYDPITDLYYLDQDLNTSLLGYGRTDKKFRTDVSSTATRPVKKMKIEVDWQGFDIGKNPSYYEDYYLLNKWQGLDKDANYFNTGTDNYTLALNTTTVPGGVYAYSKSYYTSSSQQVKRTVPPDQDMTMKAVYAGPIYKSEIGFLNKTYDSESGTLLGFSTSQSRDDMIDDDYVFEPGKTYKLYAIWQPERTGEITYYTKDFYRYFYNEERKGIEIKGINFFDSGYEGQDEVRDKLRATEKLIIPETLPLSNGMEYPVVAISEKASANGFSGESKNFPTRYEYSGLMKLKEIVFPKSLKYIGDYAFTDCSPTDWSRLQFTFDGTSIEYIGYMAFAMISSNNRSVTEDDVNLGMRLVLPKTLKTLGEAAFAGRDIKSITFEDGSIIKSIPRNCFSNVRYMYYDKKYATEANTFTLQLPDGDALRIPDSVESIDIEAFAFSRITSLEFGENSSLKTLGDGVWKGCSALKSVILPKSLTSLGPDVPMYRRASQFDNGQKWEPGYSSPKLSRPDGLGVTNVIDPEIDDSKQDYMDAIYTNGFPITASNTNGIYHTAAVFANGMFAYCTSLTNVTFRTGSTISLIPPNTFAFTKISSLDNLPSTVKTIGEYAYYGMKTNSITIPKQIERIEKGAFIANTATTISFAEGANLKYIGKEAFYKSVNLTTLVMPKSIGDSITSCGEYIFANSKKLTEVVYDEESSISIIPLGFFRGCTSITDITKAINPKIQELKDEAFMNTGITSLDLSKTKIVYIGNRVFVGTNITSLYLANGALNYIGDEAFKDVGIVSLTLPITLVSLGSRAFQGIQIEELEVPYNSSLFKIGSEVFSECKLLTTVTYDLTKVSDGMFMNCEKLSKFVAKRQITSMGSYAFAGTLIT